MTFHTQKIIFYWMIILILLILVMVSIGGATRLTNSGLSIVEWKPITGIIPPFSEEDWDNEFGKYKQFQEFKTINYAMNIEGFKKIFWLEFIHRLAGRFVGLVFFIPAIFFWCLCKFDSGTKKTVSILLILGLCQGIMGWYMVQSGLSNSPYVSHFRLAAHLFFALIMYLVLLFRSVQIFYKKNLVIKLKSIELITMCFAILQIVLGALVAGLDGGLIYNEFPLMGNSFIPDELFKVRVLDYLYSPAIVQFFHRLCGYILSIFIIITVFKLIEKRNYYLAIIVFILLFIQIYLGIFTLVNHVPFIAAILHQLFAFILVGVLLISLLFLQKSEVEELRII